MQQLAGVDPDVFARFAAKVNVTDGCWLWTAGSAQGYGVFWNGDRLERAHRFSWRSLHGPIPDGLWVLHNCPSGDNPACVNPAHLFLGTQVDNMADARTKGRTAAGDRNGSRTCPERVSRGDRHYSKLSPGRVQRGEQGSSAKLNDVVVRVIRLLVSRGVPQRKLCAVYGVTPSTVSEIVLRKTWAHIA